MDSDSERSVDRFQNLWDRHVGRRRLLEGGAVASAAAFLAACESRTGGGGSGGGASNGNFASHKNWKFVFVNHVTTNSFFVPTRYGAEDACALVGCSYQWTGSEKSVVTEMVDAFNAAVSARADGIAVAVVDPIAFNQPIQDALSQNIPVVAYNANGNGTGPWLAYIGQNLFDSGVEMGKRIVNLVDSGKVAGFIATPGSLNIQPRYDGAKQAIQQSGKNIDFREIATGATQPEELPAIDAWWQGNQDAKGLFAVDAGSTASVGQVVQKYGLSGKGVKAGGFDLLENTITGVAGGHLDFTIDQQAYLQGLFPVMQLFLYKLSGSLTGMGDTNTGLKFVTKSNVGLYQNTKTRFEGSSGEQKVVTGG